MTKTTNPSKESKMDNQPTKWQMACNNLDRHYQGYRGQVSFFDIYNTEFPRGDETFIAQIEDAMGRLGELSFWREGNVFKAVLAQDNCNSAETEFDCEPWELPENLKAWLNMEELQDCAVEHKGEDKLRWIAKFLKKNGFCRRYKMHSLVHPFTFWLEERKDGLRLSISVDGREAVLQLNDDDDNTLASYETDAPSFLIPKQADKFLQQNSYLLA